LDELEQNNTKIGIICIQEAGIKDTTDVKHLEIQHYDLFTQKLNKDCSTKGGLAIYVLKTLEAKNLKHFNTFSTWEGLSIEITIANKKNIQILNMYRPGRNNNNHASIDKFLEDFKPSLTQVTRTQKHFILTGDLNIDLLKINSNLKFQEFYDFLTTVNLIPIITFPTRTTKNPATLIDHIYCKSPKPLNPYSAI
jgi:exonuclease III